MKVCSLGIGLAVAHTLIAAAIYLQHFEGSWGGFLMFVIDFPASLVYLMLANGSWAPIFLIGALWWYLMGWIVIVVVSRIKGRGAVN